MSSLKFKLYIPLILVVFIGIMLVSIMQSRVDNPQQYATILSPPKPLTPFLLTDHNGNKFTDENLKGKWSFLFAGYTSCPDICPPTLTMFKLAAQQLESMGIKNINFILLTIDPETDTPDKLSKFVNAFDKHFIGLTGPMDNITDLTKELGLFHTNASVDEDSHIDHSQHANVKKPGIEIKHSGSVLLISPKSELYALFSPPIEVDSLVKTVASLNPSK